MKRDILNYQGVKVGELELPDETDEETWEMKLAAYAQPPPSEEDQTIQYLAATVAERKKFCEDLMDRMKQKNILDGINISQALWFHHRARALNVNMGGLSVTIDLMNLVVSGDIEVACLSLIYCQPDDMTQPYHWLSAERIDWIVKELSDYLGW